MTARIVVSLVLWIVVGVAIRQSERGSGFVQGRLTFSGTGEPAAGVPIRAVDRHQSSLASSVTDGDGRFRLTVHPGISMLSVQLPGDQKEYLSGRLGAEGTLEEGTAFRVHAGEAHTFDYALRLAGALGGRVIDADGHPVRYAVAAVEADAADNSGVEVFTHGSAVTDADGHFVVSGLAPAVYRLTVEPPDAQLPDRDGRVMVRTYYPGRDRSADAAGIVIGAGDRFDAAVITLIRAAAATSRVSGTLYEADGRPAGGKRVALVDGDRARLSMSSVTANEQGQFVFDHVVPGDYRVVAEGMSDVLNGPTVEVGREGLTDLRIQIEPASDRAAAPPTRGAGRIEGHVEHPDDTAAVLLIPEDSANWTPTSRGLAFTDVDERGDFLFEAVPTGSYRLAVVARIPPGFHRHNPAALAWLSASGQAAAVAAGETARVALGR